MNPKPPRTHFHRNPRSCKSRYVRHPLGVLALGVSAACGGAAPVSTAAIPPRPKAWGEAGLMRTPAIPPARAASDAFSPEPGGGRFVFFERLAGAARRYHVFSAATERNFGHPWDDSLPALR